MMKPIRMADRAERRRNVARRSSRTCLCRRPRSVPATAGITAGDRTANLAGAIAFQAVSADHNIQSATGPAHQHRGQ